MATPRYKNVFPAEYLQDFIKYFYVKENKVDFEVPVLIPEAIKITTVGDIKYSLARSFQYATSKSIDAVIDVEFDTVDIIETDGTNSVETLGQLMVYKKFYPLQTKKRIRNVIALCLKIDELVTDIMIDEGIKIFVWNPENKTAAEYTQKADIKAYDNKEKILWA
jgi:hypothetical protein